MRVDDTTVPSGAFSGRQQVLVQRCQTPASGTFAGGTTSASSMAMAANGGGCGYIIGIPVGFAPNALLGVGSWPGGANFQALCAGTTGTSGNREHASGEGGGSFNAAGRSFGPGEGGNSVASSSSFAGWGAGAGRGRGEGLAASRRVQRDKGGKQRPDVREQRNWLRSGPDFRRQEIDNADSWRSRTMEEAEAAIDAMGAGTGERGAPAVRRPVPVARGAATAPLPQEQEDVRAPPPGPTQPHRSPSMSSNLGEDSPQRAPSCDTTCGGVDAGSAAAVAREALFLREGPTRSNSGDEDLGQLRRHSDAESPSPSRRATAVVRGRGRGRGIVNSKLGRGAFRGVAAATATVDVQAPEPAVEPAAAQATEPAIEPPLPPAQGPRIAEVASGAWGGWERAFRHDDEMLRACGLWCKKVEADGACLFRAFSDQMEGDGGSRHLELRRTCVAFLEAHKSDFAPFVEGSFTGYCARLREPTEWAGDVEVQALSRALGVNTLIYMPAEAQSPEDVPRMSHEVANFGEDARCVQICFHPRYHSGPHYNSVRCIGDKGDAVPDKTTLAALRERMNEAILSPSRAPSRLCTRE